MRPLYFDYNATTPVHPEVLEAMLPFLTEKFGNPGSSHAWGLPAKEAVCKARKQVAGLIGAHPEEIYFTSGATESNNLALRGLKLGQGDLLLTSSIEHPAIAETAADLAEQKGINWQQIGVTSQGLLNLEACPDLHGKEPDLVSVMLANNETGVLQPVADLRTAFASPQTVIHTDAAQAVGKVGVNVSDLQVDMLSIAGHKIYAPKGIGALFVRRGIKLKAQVTGGGQEQGLRPGTENVAFIAGLGAACEMADRDLALEEKRLRSLGTFFLDELRDAGHNFILHGENVLRLPTTAYLSFTGLQSGDILSGLVAADVAASAGAACHSGKTVVSSVLRAMRVPEDIGRGTIRISWGRMTSKSDMQDFVTRLTEVLNQLPL